MCPPVIFSIFFNESSYNPGQIITATVNYTSCCTSPDFTAVASDNGARNWLLVSNDRATTAVFQATA